MTRRDSYFDNYKAFLIFLVVMAHYIEPLGEEVDFGVFVRKAVYLFHMPAFVFVSGYFSKYNSFEKLVKNLMIPYTTAQIIFYFLSNYLWDIERDFQIFKPSYTLWFLLALFVWRSVIDRLSLVFGIIPMAFLAGILVGFDDSIGKYLSLSRMITFFPYFLLGYYFKRDSFLEAVNRKSIKAAAFGGLTVIFMMLYLFSDKVRLRLLESACSYEEMELSYGWLQRGMLYIAATCVIYLLAIIMPRQKHWFSYIGSRTMGIYLTHGAIVKTLQHCTNWYRHFETTEGVLILIGLSAVLCLVLSCNVINEMIRRLSKVPVERITKRRCAV